MVFREAKRRRSPLSPGGEGMPCSLQSPVSSLQSPVSSLRSPVSLFPSLPLHHINKQLLQPLAPSMCSHLFRAALFRLALHFRNRFVAQPLDFNLRHIARFEQIRNPPL